MVKETFERKFGSLDDIKSTIELIREKNEDENILRMYSKQIDLHGNYYIMTII